METEQTFSEALDTLNQTDRRAVLRTVDLLNGYRGKHDEQTAARTLIQCGIEASILTALALNKKVAR